MESNILVIDEGTSLHELLQKLSFPKEYRVVEVADGGSAERVEYWVDDCVSEDRGIWTGVREIT